MSIKAMLHPFLNNGIEIKMDIEGNTVGDCVRDIIKHYPDMEEKMLATKDKLKTYVEILVNGKSTSPNEMAYPVKDGDSLAVLVFLAGG